MRKMDFNKQGWCVAIAAAVMMIGVGQAQAIVIAEVEPNDTLATAQNIDGFFSLDFSPNIGDTVGNTSSTIPHVTILGSGNGTFDYYSFTVQNAGDVGIFDIDFGLTPGVAGSMDTEIAVWNSAGVLLGADDDASILFGAGGSVHSFDSYLEIIFPSPGTHIVGVAEFNSTAGAGGWTGGNNVPDAGDTYTLQVSLENHHVIPEPLTASLALLGLGALGLTTLRRRHRA